MARGYRDEDARREWDDATVSIEDVHCIGATDKAILCQFPDGKECWIPQSHVHPDSEVYRRWDTGKLVISGWIAKKKGLG